MQMHRFSIIAAVDDNFGLSKDGKIPWRLSEAGKQDMQACREKTMGSSCVMGRGTYESLLPNLLPGRLCLCVSRRGVEEFSFNSVKSALEILHITSPNTPVFICGGRGIYIEALQYMDACDEILITKIDGDWKCDSAILEFQPYTMDKESTSCSSESM